MPDMTHEIGTAGVGTHVCIFTHSLLAFQCCGVALVEACVVSTVTDFTAVRDARLGLV